jgi:hypothetical protein
LCVAAIVEIPSNSDVERGNPLDSTVVIEEVHVVHVPPAQSINIPCPMPISSHPQSPPVSPQSPLVRRTTLGTSPRQSSTISEPLVISSPQPLVEPTSVPPFSDADLPPPVTAVHSSPQRVEEMEDPLHVDDMLEGNVGFSLADPLPEYPPGSSSTATVVPPVSTTIADPPATSGPILQAASSSAPHEGSVSEGDDSPFIRSTFVDETSLSFSPTRRATGPSAVGDAYVPGS